ncbi:MATE family efflux transporter [Allohahella marinimesophila]|uniref:MATE family efflux transporter n=1 Tax=Allohahella marinimesophila TaxID=1054972 RepID=A0ABP7NS38_9GAMM
MILRLLVIRRVNRLKIQVFKEVFRLSWPLSAAQIAQSLMMFTDTVMFGLLGLAELGGGGLGASIYLFIITVMTGLFSALGNEVAILSGSVKIPQQQRVERIAIVVKAGIWLALVTAGVLAVALQFLPALLPLLDQSPANIPHAATYLQMSALISFPAFVFLIFRGLAAGLGRTRSLMRISLFCCVLNTPVSYLLMGGVGSWDGFGVAGVAMGTAVVQLLMLVLLLRELWRDEQVKPVLEALRGAAFDIRQLVPFWTLGVPIALAWAMEIGLFTMATILAGTLGLVALAAHQIAFQTASLSFNIYIGIAQGTAIRVGQCFGSGQIALAFRYMRAGLALGALFCAIAAAVFVLVPHWLVGLFTLGVDSTASAAASATDSADQAAQLRALSIQLLFVAAIFQAVDCVQVILMTVTRAFRMGTSPTVVAAVSYWLIGFPAAWVGLQWLGLIGIWLGLGLGLAAAALGLGYLLRRFARLSGQQQLEYRA